MANINVLVKNIVTTHTTDPTKLDSPRVDITLECNIEGNIEKKEIKFSELLVNLVDKSPDELRSSLIISVTRIVKQAYLGQKALDPVSNNWVHQDEYVGKSFTIAV